MINLENVTLEDAEEAWNTKGRETVLENGHISKINM